MSKEEMNDLLGDYAVKLIRWLLTIAGIGAATVLSLVWAAGSWAASVKGDLTVIATEQIKVSANMDKVWVKLADHGERISALQAKEAIDNYNNRK